MPLSSKLRRRVGDAVDGERCVLPPLAAVSRPSPLTHCLWSVEEPELVRSASHLRAIARQHQSHWTKPKSQPVTTSVSPHTPLAGLVPLTCSKPQEPTSRINNNDVEADPVLKEIWRVAATAAKQQSFKAVEVDSNSRNVQSTGRPRVLVGNQEAETSHGNGTTKARFRRLVGMVARKALATIIHQAAANVLKVRLENGGALCIQRVVRRFMGRRRRARLRFELVDAVEKIERQWKRTKARRAAATRIQEREKREQERKKAEEERLAAARDIQVRYREFVETQKKRKAEETKAAETRERVQHQQRMAREQMRSRAALMIQRKLRAVWCNAREVHRRPSEAAHAERLLAAAENDDQSVKRNSDQAEAVEVIPWRTATTVVDEAEASHARFEAVDELLILAGSERVRLDAAGPTSSPPKSSGSTHRPRSFLNAVDVSVLESKAAVASLQASVPCVSRKESGGDQCSLRNPELFTSSTVNCQVRVQTSVSSVMTSRGFCSIPGHGNEPPPFIVDAPSIPSASAPAPALRRARAVISRFVSTRCLSRLRDQLHEKHTAARRLQQLARRHLSRRRVAFQRQLHLISLRSELQAQWLQSGSLLMASFVGDDTATPPEHPTTQQSHYAAADSDELRLEDEDEDFLLAEEAHDSKADSPIGLSWAELLPTRNGVIPPGLRLNLSATHGPSCAAAPSLGLWKWSWASQQWQPNRDLFRVGNQS